MASAMTLPPSNAMAINTSNATPATSASSATPASSSASISPLDLDTSDRSMNGAELALLSLQSKSVEALTTSVLSRPRLTEAMRGYLRRLGIEHTITHKIKVVHVAGTKGKGSTAAFTERILREHGFRTLLYSSPHLVELTERFRVNGLPVSRQVFLNHFWSVWDRLKETRHEAGDDPPLPAYFRFLTLIAFHMCAIGTEVAQASSDSTHPATQFPSLSLTSFVPPIDIVILEVGMGGKLDATNIVPQPLVTAISSIGYDHMEVLGYTLEEIAAEKAGIVKRGVPLYSTDNQQPEVKEVMRKVAMDEEAESVHFAQPLPMDVKLGLAGAHQYENAGLAVAVAHHALCSWAKLYPNDARVAEFTTSTRLSFNLHSLPPKFLHALADTHWPGRCQRLRHPHPELRQHIEIFLDGAHTDASMKVACKWAEEEMERAAEEQRKANVKGDVSIERVLLFNCGHVRDPIDLMLPLVQLSYPSLRRKSSEANLASANGGVISASTCTSSAPARPISFSRLICCPFDHDRPHLSRAPNLRQLLRNYLLPQVRKSNTTVAMERKASNASADFAPAVAAGESKSVIAAPAQQPIAPAAQSSLSSSSSSGGGVTITTPHIHPIILRFFADRFNFPSAIASSTCLPDSCVYQEAEACIDQVLESFSNSLFDVRSCGAPTGSWQEALFQVWNLLHHIFQYEMNKSQQNADIDAAAASPSHSTPSATQCLYSPSVARALHTIVDAMRERSSTSSSPQTHIQIFATGSLYLVGNVLHALDVSPGNA